MTDGAGGGTTGIAGRGEVVRCSTVRDGAGGAGAGADGPDRSNNIATAAATPIPAATPASSANRRTQFTAGAAAGESAARNDAVARP